MGPGISERVTQDTDAAKRGRLERSEARSQESQAERAKAVGSNSESVPFDSDRREGALGKDRERESQSNISSSSSSTLHSKEKQHSTAQQQAETYR